MSALPAKHFHTRRGARMAACPRLVVPGKAGAAVGIIGLAAATLCAQDALRSAWVLIWLVASVTGALTGAVAIAACAHRTGRLRWSDAVWPVFARLLPALCAGAVLTYVLWKMELTWMLPGTWLLLYGAALLYLSGVAARGQKDFL